MDTTDPIDPNKDVCAECSARNGKDGNELKKCSRCKIYSYCGTECQKKHWEDCHNVLCIAANVTAKTITEIEAHCAVELPTDISTASAEASAAKASTKKMSTSDEEECANCAAVGGRGEIRLSKCSKCLMVAYCSRACQVQHWKDGGHKRFCMSPSERALPRPESNKKGIHPSAALQSKEDMCIICDDRLNESSACALPCGHKFHAACVANMRQFGVSQACPLCRAPLPPGPDSSREYARREYTEVSLGVQSSGGSWHALSASDEKRMMEVVRCVRAAADQGSPGAMTMLGDMYLRGEGMAQDEVEGLNWYGKAATQGYAAAQRKLKAALPGARSSSTAEAKEPVDSVLAQMLTQAQARADDGDFKTSAKIFRKACALDNTSVEAWYGLGNCLARGPDEGAALKEREKCWRRVIELDPTCASAQFGLAVVLRAAGDVNGAEKSLRRSIELDPTSAEAHVNLGVLLKAKGDLSGAEKCNRRAIALAPTDVDAHSNLGTVLQAKRDLHGAEVCYRRAIELDPHSVRARSNLGSVLMLMGDLNGAEQTFRLAIELDPRHIGARCNLGSVLHEKGDMNGAEKNFRRALEIDPRNLDAHNNFGAFLKEKADALEATGGDPKAVARLLLKAAEHRAQAHGAQDGHVVAARSKAARLLSSR